MSEQGSQDPSTPLGTVSADTAEDEAAQQRLRDFRLTIEYKYLVDHAPGGVFMLPALGDNRTLFGVVFVRRGPYRNGIFRFTVLLPPMYNSHAVSPQVTFTPPVFNPLVDQASGVMQLTMSDALLPPSQWNPEKHFLATVVTTVKKIFYIKSYDSFPAGSLANESARALHTADSPAFQKRVDSCVRQSLESAEAEGAPAPAASTGPTADENSIRFSPAQSAHEVIRQAILGELLAARAAELQAIRRSKGAVELLHMSSGDSSADPSAVPPAAGGEASSSVSTAPATAVATAAGTVGDYFDAIEAEDRLLADEVMSALQIFGDKDIASKQSWASSVLYASTGSSSAGKDRVTGESPGAGGATVNAAAVFYDISNEVEDEDDAATRRT